MGGVLLSGSRRKEPQSSTAGLGCRAFQGERLQIFAGQAIAPLQQQPAGGVAVPAVGVGEQGDELLIGGRGQCGRGGSRLAVGSCDSPEAATAAAVEQIGAVLQFVGHELRVFDHSPSHVDHIQAAIGPIGQGDRPKPVVG